MSFTPPKFGRSSFNCPHCGAFSSQAWYELFTTGDRADLTKAEMDVKVGFAEAPKASYGTTKNVSQVIAGLRVTRCSHCSLPSIWWGSTLAHPEGSQMPDAHVDMPASTRAIYDEARAVYRHSPRAAAGLLRLALEDLLRSIGIKGTSLASQIKTLSDQGLPPELVEAMEVVRITGNDALHAGEIRIHEDPEVAPLLFQIVNTIVQSKITFRKSVERIAKKIPDEKKSLLSRVKGAATTTSTDP